MIGAKSDPERIDELYSVLSGLGMGSPFRSTAFITLKMRVFAPIPSASVKTTVTMNQGELTNCLVAEIPKPIHRVTLVRSSKRRRFRFSKR
ncbi:MAG TPA: hypothetical protein VMP68_06415, partial [Candidatus Eisenbacteria bacterium]|nr:hypothetical protein [Candidatus Eisenbacteria bacterium]